MRSNVILLGTSPSRDQFVSEEIELKVRKLLGKTELKDIANTAKVFVEVVDQDKAVGALMIESMSNPGPTAREPVEVKPRMFDHVNSMLTQKKINL